MIITEQFKTEIYENYRQKVFRYIVSKINNGDLAEELCEDVFLKVYDNLESFDEAKASISTWIYTIARNTLTDYYRTRKVHEEIPEDLEDSYSIEEDICNREMLKNLADALEKLDERSRDIVVLRYYSGLTMKKIAERMNISYSYVQLLHNNALKDMKKYME